MMRAISPFILPAFLLTAIAAVLFGPPAPSLAADCTDVAQANVDWRRCYLEQRRLDGEDLTGADLRAARFHRSSLIGTIFDKVEARRAKFISVQAEGARFRDADLRETDFTGAMLDRADFTGADLRKARLFRASLRGAIFLDARIDGADLLSSDLTGATWTDGRVCGDPSIGQCN